LDYLLHPVHPKTLLGNETKKFRMNFHPNASARIERNAIIPNADAIPFSTASVQASTPAEVGVRTQPEKETYSLADTPADTLNATANATAHSKIYFLILILKKL
jgi:hypothetical protein